MSSQCINSLSGHKSATGSGFSGIDFLYDVESLTIWSCFLCILAIFCSASAVSTILLLPVEIWLHSWIHRPHFPIKTRSFWACDTIFGDFCGDNVCACTVIIIIIQYNNSTIQYNNSTAGHKCLTENGFSDICFLQDVEFLAVQHCFSPILTTFHCACTVLTLLLLSV